MDYYGFFKELVSIDEGFTVRNYEKIKELISEVKELGESVSWDKALEAWLDFRKDHRDIASVCP